MIERTRTGCWARRSGPSRGNYHFNQLSAPQVRQDMAQRFGTVQLTRVADMLKDSFGYAHSYNRRSHALIAGNRASAWD